MCLCGDNNNNMCFMPLEKSWRKLWIRMLLVINPIYWKGDHIVYCLCWSTLGVKGALVVIIPGQQVKIMTVLAKQKCLEILGHCAAQNSLEERVPDLPNHPDSCSLVRPCKGSLPSPLYHPNPLGAIFRPIPQCSYVPHFQTLGDHDPIPSFP